MSQIVRTVISRLSEFLGKPSYKRVVRLPLSISLNTTYEGVRQLDSDSYTYDLSKTGISFIVPTLRIGNGHIFHDNDSTLRIKVELPTGRVEMNVALTRFDKWDESEFDSMFIVGARIIEMSESSRKRYIEFLHKPQPSFAGTTLSAAPTSASAIST